MHVKAQEQYKMDPKLVLVTVVQNWKYLCKQYFHDICIWQNTQAVMFLRCQLVFYS